VSATWTEVKKGRGDELLLGSTRSAKAGTGERKRGKSLVTSKVTLLRRRGGKILHPQAGKKGERGRHLSERGRRSPPSEKKVKRGKTSKDPPPWWGSFSGRKKEKRKVCGGCLAHENMRRGSS